MTAIKSYTDIEQSRKLANILPAESADMCYKCIEDDPYDVVFRPFSEWREEYKGLLVNKEVDVIPCWSLAALLKIIKYYDIEADDGIVIKRKLCYEPYQITTQKHNDIINACIEMILKLKESDLI